MSETLRLIRIVRGYIKQLRYVAKCQWSPEGKLFMSLIERTLLDAFAGKNLERRRAQVFLTNPDFDHYCRHIGLSSYIADVIQAIREDTECDAAVTATPVRAAQHSHINKQGRGRHRGAGPTDPYSPNLPI
jgi:hypothetical protein